MERVEVVREALAEFDQIDAFALQLGFEALTGWQATTCGAQVAAQALRALPGAGVPLELADERAVGVACLADLLAAFGGETAEAFALLGVKSQRSGLNQVSRFCRVAWSSFCVA